MNDQGPRSAIGIGLNLDLTAFRDGSVLLLAGSLLAVASLTKFAGCGLAALRLGWKDATRIGVGMIPRGEVGMVIAQLGLSMGVIPAATYGIVVFMSIGTTLVAPPLLALAFRGVQAEAPDGGDVPRIG